MQALIAICVCLILAFGVQTFRIGALKEEAAEKAAALATATAAAEKESRTREQQMADNARRAADEYAKNAARIRASADGARTELDSLRNTLAAAGAVPADPTAASRADEAARARYVLGQCFATVQALAATSDDIETRLSGLQDWARAITSGGARSATAPEKQPDPK